MGNSSNGDAVTGFIVIRSNPSPLGCRAARCVSFLWMKARLISPSHARSDPDRYRCLPKSYLERIWRLVDAHMHLVIPVHAKPRFGFSPSFLLRPPSFAFLDPMGVSIRIRPGIIG